MKMTATDLQRLGVVDEVIPEAPGGAHRDHDASAQAARRGAAPAPQGALLPAARGAARGSLQEVPPHGGVRRIRRQREVTDGSARLVGEALRLNARYVEEVVIGWDLCPWAARAWLDGQVVQRVFTDEALDDAAPAGAFIDDLIAKPGRRDRPRDLSARRVHGRRVGALRRARPPDARRPSVPGRGLSSRLPRAGRETRRRARRRAPGAVHPAHARSDAAAGARVARRPAARRGLRRRRPRELRERDRARPRQARRPAGRHPAGPRRQLRTAVLGGKSCCAFTTTPRRATPTRCACC